MSLRSRNAQRSILEDLGEEVTGILTPVSICMALTVMLVKTLNPTGESDARSVFIASAFYTEKVINLYNPAFRLPVLRTMQRVCTIKLPHTLMMPC